MNDFWTVALGALQQEFSDMNDVEDAVRILVRLFVAMVLGGLIGFERESSGKSAGLRTHMLVAVGAALFVLAPSVSGMEIGDQSRVLQGIIAGIGFLGAGAIIKAHSHEQVKGLTTAASIWLTAAVGITAGMGREMLALVSTLFALFILGVLHRFERKIDVNPTARHGGQAKNARQPGAQDGTGNNHSVDSKDGS
ncbi:MgtC/SapB family protein [Orrella sp. JC864]|uniref:MgtC/SapB family protein n=1 Tax=Orrella sp. JC864 TaxID=3120298 RepID=UPI0012BBDF0F